MQLWDKFDCALRENDQALSDTIGALNRSHWQPKPRKLRVALAADKHNDTGFGPQSLKVTGAANLSLSLATFYKPEYRSEVRALIQKLKVLNKERVELRKSLQDLNAVLVEVSDEVYQYNQDTNHHIRSYSKFGVQASVKFRNDRVARFRQIYELLPNEVFQLEDEIDELRTNFANHQKRRSGQYVYHWVERKSPIIRMAGPHLRVVRFRAGTMILLMPKYRSSKRRITKELLSDSHQKHITKCFELGKRIEHLRPKRIAYLDAIDRIERILMKHTRSL